MVCATLLSEEVVVLEEPFLGLCGDLFPVSAASKFKCTVGNEVGYDDLLGAERRLCWRG